MIGSWKNILATEFEKPYFKELSAFVDMEYKKHTCYPPKEDIFKALELEYTEPQDRLSSVKFGK